MIIGVRYQPAFNLGWLISDEMSGRFGYDYAKCFDLQETHGVDKLDVRDAACVEKAFLEHQPRHVIYCVGINEPTVVDNPLISANLTRHFDVNVTAMVRCLHNWLDYVPNSGQRGHFVAIVSNSSRIPRTRSLAYCASKAAQAMALRVAARELAGVPGLVYGYEPGFLAGTPMSAGVSARLGDVAPHRMRGVDREGLNPASLAELVVTNIERDYDALNGQLIPFDAGEL